MNAPPADEVATNAMNNYKFVTYLHNESGRMATVSATHRLFPQDLAQAVVCLETLAELKFRKEGLMVSHTNITQLVTVQTPRN